jgi:hypothetical protein
MRSSASFSMKSIGLPLRQDARDRAAQAITCDRSGATAHRGPCARHQTLPGIAMVLKHLYHARGSDGIDYEVHVYVEPAGHTNAHIERIARLSLADGRELHVLSRRHYQIVGTGVTLQAQDEQAI